MTAYPMVEGHEADEKTSMTCVPDRYLSPLSQPRGGQKPGYGEHLWKMAGRLLVAERLWLNTARVVAMVADRSVLANVFWPIKTDDDAWDKVLAIWLNSSLGLLTLLARRTTTRAGWSAMKKADLARLPVADVRQLTDKQIADCSNLFDELADASFERLPAMVDCPCPLKTGYRLVGNSWLAGSGRPEASAGVGAGRLESAAVNRFTH